MFDEYQNHDKAVYASFMLEDDEILKSSSGGVATAMAKYVIKNGGKVAGVTYNSDFMSAEYVLIDSIADLDRLRGSKVISVNSNGIFKKVEEALKTCQVLFFGLPCMVAALKKYLKVDYGNLILCELICSGKASDKIHKEYCKELLSRYGSSITSFTVRGKDTEWLPEMMKVQFSNGKEYNYPFKKTEYGQAFKILKEEGCLRCGFKGNNRQGDIMIGDYWGATPDDVFWNKRGVSVVFCETQKGFDFFQKIDGLYKLETTFSRAVEHNLSVIHVTKKHPERDSLIGIFREKGMFAAMKQSKAMRHVKRTNMMEKLHILPFLKKIKSIISI